MAKETSRFAAIKQLSTRQPANPSGVEEHFAEAVSPQHHVPPPKPQELQLPADFGKDLPGPQRIPDTSEEQRKPRGRPKGKRSNPDFEQTTLFLRMDTKRAAMRLLQDQGAGDLSSLTERLLAAWVKKNG